MRPTDKGILDPIDGAELAALRARSAGGLVLTQQQARMLSTRLMLQAPKDLTPRQIKAVADDLDSRVRGLPPGAFMALDALRLLADGGNAIAADLFDQQSRVLGLTRPFQARR